MIDLENSVLAVHDHNQKLTVRQLAEAIYEGTPHVRNLAEKLARQHGKAGALSFFNMMGEDIQNFYMNIAQQLIDHAKEWEDNDGSACCLSKKESERLKKLERHPFFKKNKKEKRICVVSCDSVNVNGDKGAAVYFYTDVEDAEEAKELALKNPNFLIHLEKADKKYLRFRKTSDDGFKNGQVVYYEGDPRL